MKWKTKDGVEIEIKLMATPHLLSAIHMIERSRLNNLLSISQRIDNDKGLVEYYSQFPQGYQELCNEAERRNLIQRNPNVYGETESKDSKSTKISKRR